MSLISPRVANVFCNHIITIDRTSVWKRTQNQLRMLYGEAIFNSWISFLKFISSGNGKVLLSVPTKFIKEWISIHYADKILSLWQNEDSTIHSLDIRVIKEEDVIIDRKDYRNITNNCDNISSPLDPRFTFDNFVVGKPNELAFAAAKRIAKSSTSIAESNPLFLYGGIGLGKTHLMHAIAWYIVNTSSKRKVAYLSAEKFMCQYIIALRNRDIMVFKEQFRSIDVLMIDDVQFISGKDSTQEELFHTFNALLIDQNKQLVISADRSPSSLNGVEDRIKSRLGWGLVADINETTFELRLGILESKVKNIAIDISSEVLEFLAKNVKSNIRELEGALNKIVAHSSLNGRNITVEFARDTLSDLLRSNYKVVSIDEIQKKVAEFFKIKLSDIYSTKRTRSLSRPRQVAMYLAKILTQKSLPDIGRSFGGRDHTTIIHAVKQIENLIKVNADLANDVDSLIKMIRMC